MWINADPIWWLRSSKAAVLLRIHEDARCGVLAAVSTNSGELDVSEQHDDLGLIKQPATLLERLVERTIALLASSKQPNAKLALQLLPAVERFITRHQPEMLQGFSQQIWDACR